jgi:hypothetical protein
MAASGLGGKFRGPFVPGACNAHPKGVSLDLINPKGRFPLAFTFGEGNVDRLGLLRCVELDGCFGDNLVAAPDRNLARPSMVPITSLISSSLNFFPSSSLELNLQVPLNA